MPWSAGIGKTEGGRREETVPLIPLPPCGTLVSEVVFLKRGNETRPMQS